MSDRDRVEALVETATQNLYARIDRSGGRRPGIEVSLIRDVFAELASDLRHADYAAGMLAGRIAELEWTLRMTNADAPQDGRGPVRAVHIMSIAEQEIRRRLAELREQQKESDDNAS